MLRRALRVVSRIVLSASTFSVAVATVRADGESPASSAETFVADGPRTFLALPGRGATVVVLLAPGIGASGRRFVVLVSESAPSPDEEASRLVEIPAGTRRLEIPGVAEGRHSVRVLRLGEDGLPTSVSAPITLEVRALAFEPSLPGPPVLYGREDAVAFYVPRGTRLVLPEGVVCAVGGGSGVRAPAITSPDDRLVCRDDEGRDVPAPPVGVTPDTTFPATVATPIERRFPEANGQMLAGSSPSPGGIPLRAPTPDPAQLAALTAGLGYVPVQDGSDVVRATLAADVSVLEGRYSLTFALPIALGGETDSRLRMGSGDLLLLGTAELLERRRLHVRADFGSFLPTQRGTSGIGHARVLSSLHLTEAVGERHLLRMRHAGIVETASGGACLFASAYGWDVRVSREDRWSLGLEIDTSFGREGGTPTTALSSVAAVTLAFDVVQLWFGGRVSLTNDAERTLGRGALLFGLRGAAF